jgi:hypothetical protein
MEGMRDVFSFASFHWQKMTEKNSKEGEKTDK